MKERNLGGSNGGGKPLFGRSERVREKEGTDPEVGTSKVRKGGPDEEGGVSALHCSQPPSPSFNIVK